MKEIKNQTAGQLDLPLPSATQLHTPSRKRSRVIKKPSGLRQKLLLASLFVPLGVELIRLIEELIKSFTQ